VFTSFLNPLSNKIVTLLPTLLPEGIAGYSTDGTKIYVDIIVPAWMWTPLVTHETLEMALVLDLGFKYDWAHQQATQLERKVVESLQQSWDEYDKTCKGLIDMVAKRTPKPPAPPDLATHT
jgi:hypothetical protein